MSLRILLIEDNEDDSYFFSKALSKCGIPAVVDTAISGVSGIETIKQNHYDYIFLDYYLPGENGLNLLRKIRSFEVNAPVIMLTGQKNEQIIVKLIQEGATDYLSKDFLNPESLRLCIENAQKLHKAEQEKVQAEKDLRISEAKLAEAQTIAKLGNWEYDTKSKSFFFSREAHRILELSQNFDTPSIMSFSRRILPEDFLALKKIKGDIKYSPYYEITFRIYSSDDSIKHLHIRGQLTYDSEQNLEKAAGTIQDITDIENALRETRKANIKRRATSIVFSVAILIFLISEALVDPFIDSLAAGILITLSFKGSIALGLKPVELFLEKIMMNKVASGIKISPLVKFVKSGK